MIKIGRKMYIEKEVLVEAIKEVMESKNIAWSGPFALKKNSISDMAYLCWGVIRKKVKTEDEWKLWEDIERSIKLYGLKTLQESCNNI